MEKSASERIAELNAALNDLSNRYRAMEDRVRVVEAELLGLRGLAEAVDEATVRIGLLGV